MITSLVIGLVLGATSGDKLEIRPKHVRPTTMAALFRHPKSNLGHIEADDLEGIVRFWGATEDLEKLPPLIAKFDVPRMEIYLRFRHHNEVQKLDYSGTVVMPNGVPFSFGDGESGTRFSIRPMLTERGTIRGAFEFHSADAVFKLEKEFKLKSQIILKVPDMTPTNQAAKKMLQFTDARLFPNLHIYAENKSIKN